MSLLAERVPSLPHLGLGTAPSPVRPLDLGVPDLWVKDESAYGDGPWGGNKVRKLEWILPDLEARGTRTVLTVGGEGTHWGLAFALYARERGIHTVLGLLPQPEDEHVAEQRRRIAESGATVLHYPSPWRLRLAAPALLARHRARLIGPGGSTPVGNLGYVDVALELAAQVAAGDLPEPGTVVVPVGSAGTLVGLALGLRLAGLRSRLVGVVVNDLLTLDDAVVSRAADRTAKVLGRHGLDVPGPGSVDVRREWLGAGYGHATPAGDEAIARAADAGLELEPVYTAKALAAVLDPAAAFVGPVLFVNTHGPR
jgi:D-cysteine desulfhydrase